MVIPGHRFDLSHLGFGHSTIFEPGWFTFSHLELFHLEPRPFSTCFEYFHLEPE